MGSGFGVLDCGKAGMVQDLTLNPEQQAVFDSIPADSPRSRLDPYRALILRWRGQRKTYRRIRQLLLEKFSIQVSTAMVHKFVQKHNRPRKPAEPDLEIQIGSSQQLVVAVPNAEQPATTERKRLTSKERAAQREFFKALRDKPVIVPEATKPRFEYDPNKPLTINRNIKD